MSEKNIQAGAGDTVELADKDTGFFDSETKLKLVRSQTAKLGPTIGKATNLAILSGQLLIVEAAAKPAGKKAKADDAE